MTHPTALALSADLAQAGFAHTVNVATSPQIPAPVAHVSLGLPSRYEGDLSEAILLLEMLADRHGLRLYVSGGELTFGTGEGSHA